MRRVRAALPYVLLGVGLAVTGLFIVLREPSNEPLDPRSNDPLGLRALVLVLDELGGDVRVIDDVPGAREDTALLLVDELTDERRGELEQWVRDGGRLVVADSASPLVPLVVGETAIGPIDGVLFGECDLAALAEVDRVNAPGSQVYQRPPRSVACYERGEGVFLVATARGEGTIVALGGPLGFANRWLGDDDNAVLAANLLIPTGSERVAVLRPPPPQAPGTGDEGLSDLIPPVVWVVLFQLLMAFVVFSWWRARRLGRPVLEPEPVEIAGSELVVAVGQLLQSARSPDRAGALLRDDTRRWLADRLGLARGVPLDVLAEAAAARSVATSEQVLGVLGGPDITDEVGLVRLATQIERLRRDVLQPDRVLESGMA